MKTAMQEMLFEIGVAKMNCATVTATPEIVLDVLEGFAKILLMKERTQIVDAGNKCGIVKDVDPDGNVKMFYESGKQYYTTTYGQ